jgi:hypothetical protein
VNLVYFGNTKRLCNKSRREINEILRKNKNLKTELMKRSPFIEDLITKVDNLTKTNDNNK